MYTPPQQTASLLAAAQRRLAAIMHITACYLIPGVILVSSLCALLLWHDQYRFSGDLPLKLRVVAQDAIITTPQAALARLATQPAVASFDTHLSETPFWLSVDTVYRIGGPEVIEFPSRHALEMSCWDSAGMAFIGSATRSSPAAVERPVLTAAKAGFALRLAFMPAQLLCRASFTGPAHVGAIQWPADQFALSVDQYHRKSGLLDGGMIVLALFVLIIAAVERNVLYLAFAGWLILNLRIGAMLAGWDVQWLGQMLPPGWLMLSQRLNVVLYSISLLTLYQMLLGEHLVRPRQRLPLRIIQWLCLPTLVAAVVLPFRLFVPMILFLSAAGIFLLSVDLVRILFAARNRVAVFFAASLVISFGSGMARIVAETVGLREAAAMIDSVTAALVSTLLAALAVAEHARLEKGQRMVSEAGIRQAWQAVPAGLFSLGADGRFVSANPALCAMLGGAGIVSGRTPWQQFFSEASWRRLQELAAAGQLAEMDVEPLHGGRRFVIRATLVNGRIEGVLEDLTEASRTRDLLHDLAHRDPLTGVLNRRGIDNAFAQSGGTPGAGQPLALAFLELDRFKLISDLYGRSAADEVLKQVCERMTAVLPSGQHIGRIGGDAFLVLMPHTSPAAAAQTCRDIVLRVGSLPYLVGDKAFTMRASAGLVEVTNGMLMADAVASADRACRDAGAAAGHGLATQAPAAEAQLVARLSSPNATEGMFLEMQPIMAFAAPSESLNFAVLLRMRDADGSTRGASPILAAALASGRAGVIDRWLLTTTLAWIERHAARLPPVFYVCIKVSGAALNDEHFVQELMAILGQHAPLARRLCIAISERVALQDLEYTRRFMDQLRPMGVKIALDDFGAGLSSFSYLKELPADLLKIDTGLVAGLTVHPANAAVVEAIVQLARTLGMQTSAPGANDVATVQVLARLGVDYVQGDGVAPAQPFDALLGAQSSASFVDCGTLPELFEIGSLQRRAAATLALRPAN
jgi:diguanylate cyclase (GGDEF)-like protein